MSVNIIIEKAWAEHRTFFITFFVIPYVILLLAYFTWSNFTGEYESVCDPNGDDGYFGSEMARQNVAIFCWLVIVVGCAFFGL